MKWCIMTLPTTGCVSSPPPPLGNKIDIADNKQSKVSALSGTIPTPYESAPSSIPPASIPPAKPIASDDTLAAKTSGFVGSFFSKLGSGAYAIAHGGYRAGAWAANTAYWAGMRGVEKFLETVCISGNLDKDYQENLAKLKNLTGNDGFGLFLSQISKTLAAKLKEKGEPEGIWDTIKEGIWNTIAVDEEVVIEQLLQTVLTKAMANIGAVVQEERSEGADAPVSAVDIFAYLSKVVKDQISTLQTDSADDKASDAAEALMRLAFPKGAEELPLRLGIRELAWSKLKKMLRPKSSKSPIPPKTCQY